jgi:hypothetical protein
MESFEAVTAAILQRQGYWTQTSVKVNLTKAEKRAPVVLRRLEQQLVD